MESLNAILDAVSESVLDADEEIQSITIELIDVDVAIATTSVISELPDEVRDPDSSEETQELLTALSNSRTEDVQITADEHIQTIHQLLADFETEWNIQEDVSQSDITIQPTRLVYRGESWGITAEFEITDSDMSWVDEFAPIVVEESSMIDAPELLRSMSVRIILGDEFQPFDYTIYFATDEPQEYWANCETLEEYCEMVAEQNDDVTVAELLEQDEYQSHTHLMNQQEGVNDWFRPFVVDLIESHFESSDAVTISPAQFNTDFEEYTLTGVIRQSL